MPSERSSADTKYVRLTIRDTGSGIPPEVAHDLGDRPFGKFSAGFHAHSQEISQYLDQQGRIQTITL